MARLWTIAASAGKSHTSRRPIFPRRFLERRPHGKFEKHAWPCVGRHMAPLLPRGGAALVVAFVLAACASFDPFAPPASRGEAMITAATPHAVEAGLEMLRAGGSAVDAAIAAELVLGLVEPQSSGIGGGGFLLHYDAAREAITAYDGRERAPAGATPTM